MLIDVGFTTPLEKESNFAKWSAWLKWYLTSHLAGKIEYLSFRYILQAVI